MSQQNPWKKQMMMNKTQNINNTANTNSPNDKFPPTQQQTTPPWMKKKQQAPNMGLTVNSNQPGLMKNNQQNINTQSPNVSSWMKNKQSPSTSSLSQPAWMKNNKQNGPTQGQSNQNVPAWMQNKTQPSNVPAWKAGGTTFGADKKKKQQQQRLKKQQEQRQKQQRQEQQRQEQQRQEQQRQEQQRIISQKIRQKQNQVQQAMLMEEQDNLSRLRQLKEKQIQEQRKRDQQNSRNKKVNKSKLNQSSTKNIYRKKPPQSQEQPFYIRYLYFYKQSLNSSLQYKQRLDNQKQLLKICKTYSMKMQEKVIQIVKSNTQRKLLSSTKKNKIINVDELNTQISYGFCEGQQVQIISQQQHQTKNNIKFDTSSIQRLQSVFQFYNCLNDILCLMSRKLASSIISKFRVPLLTIVHYKGMAFLCQAYTEELLQTQGVLPSEYKQIFNQFIMIQKQLKQVHHYNLTKNDLVVKKIFVKEVEQEIYVFYLKNWDVKLAKNMCKRSVSLQQLTTDYYFLSQTNQRNLSLFSQNDFEVFRKVKTQAFSQLSDVVQLAQSIFIVYSSCQGQVEQKQFWQLILSESQQIWNLIRFAGYKGKLFKQKRLLFKYFQVFSGLKIQFQNRKSSKNQKISMKQCTCKRETYDFRKIQLNEILRNFQKYLKQNKFQLAELSLSTTKDLYISKDEQSKTQTQIQLKHATLPLQYVLKQAKYLMAKLQYKKAIKLLEEYSKCDLLKNRNYSNIAVKIQLLVLYIKLKKQVKVLRTFKQLLQLVQFHYGQQTLINATLYQMLGSYYSLNANYNQQGNQATLLKNVITLYEHALSIVLKFYGDQSAPIAEVYLFRAISFFNLSNIQLFNKDIQHALKIFKSLSRQGDKIAECLFYKGRVKIQEGKNQIKKEGIQLIQQSSLIYLKLCHYPEAVEGFLYIMKSLDEKVQQNLKKIQCLTKQVIDVLFDYFRNIKYLKKVIGVVLQKLDPQLKRLIMQIQQRQQKQKQANNVQQKEQGQSQEDQLQLIIGLQEMAKGFTSFAQMIRWLGWTAFSMAKSQTHNNASKDRFNEIARVLGKIITLKQKNQPQIYSQTSQQQDTEKNISQSPSKSGLFQNSQISQISSVSPIRNLQKSGTERDFQNINNEEQI